MKCDNTHVLYVNSDFTKEEIARKNIIAVSVIIHKMKICKMCGGRGYELKERCGKTSLLAKIS